MGISKTNLRSFIGAQDYKQSIAFYKELGFTVKELEPKMSVITISDQCAFYLQDAYVKDWVDNSMLFFEVDDIEAYAKEIASKELTTRYKKVKLSGIKTHDWGSVFYLHDPSGILWHIGSFKK